MNNVAGQEESRRGNRLPVPGDMGAEAEFASGGGVGLTSVNNSDNHYILHRHCLSDALALSCSVSVGFQCQQLAPGLILSAELSEAEGDATVTPSSHFMGEHAEAERGEATCLRSLRWSMAEPARCSECRVHVLLVMNSVYPGSASGPPFSHLHNKLSQLTASPTCQREECTLLGALARCPPPPPPRRQPHTHRMGQKNHQLGPGSPQSRQR